MFVCQGAGDAGDARDCHARVGVGGWGGWSVVLAGGAANTQCRLVLEPTVLKLEKAFALAGSIAQGPWLNWPRMLGAPVPGVSA